jgi:hypothetical protein
MLFNPYRFVFHYGKMEPFVDEFISTPVVNVGSLMITNKHVIALIFCERI